MVFPMRIFIALFASFSLAAPVRAEIPQPFAAPAQLSKVEFVQEIAAAGTKKLLGQGGNRFFLAKPDGAVQVISTGKNEAAFILSGKGRKGEALIKHPEAVVAAGDTLYVADSELSRIVMFTADGKYKGSFGRKGSGPGELRSPQGIAFHDGILYVADSGNGRIQLFGDNGVFLNTLEIDSAPANKAAKNKKLPYQLNKPVAIAIDPAGRMIYVLDADNSLFSEDLSLKVYGPDGTFLKQLPKSGKPTALSAVPDGLYVADQENFAIQKYDVNGKLVSSFGSKGDGRAQFKSMDGVTADNGQVYVGDSARGAILDFRADTSSLPAVLEPRQGVRTFVHWTENIPATINHLAWDGKDTLYGINPSNGTIVRIRNGAIDGEIKVKSKDVSPAALAMDRSGGLWILDNRKMQLLKLDDTGNPLVTIGSSGSRNGQFDDPAGIAISSNGIIFVADAGNHRVQAFSDDGVFLSAISDSASGKLRHPAAIALDPQDNLYVLDTDRSVVSVYSAKGDALLEFGKSKANETSNLNNPRALIATQDEVFIAEPNQIKVYTHDGKYARAFGAPGAENGEFSEIESIAAKDATTFFVAEHGNKRVQSFTTLYKPAPPAQVAAQGAAHAVVLQWTPSPLPYVAQYQIYRSKSENGAFVRIGTSKTNQFSDDGLPPEEKYYYRVAAESGAGYEGPACQTIGAVSQKYSPPLPEDIQAAPTAVQLKLSWKPLDSRYISAYLIYRKDGDAYTKVGETVAPEFTLTGLTPGTDYTLYLSARSVDGIESEKSLIHGATTADTNMPLDINVMELRNVFSNTYKLYEQEGVGKARLTNNTTDPQKNIKVSFVLNNFMDYPTETRINALAPGESKEITLKAVFNNNILTLTEDTPVQAKVEASYYVNGQRKVFSSVKTINIYDKHRLMWNEPGRYAAFITPKDPPLIDFVRSVVAQYGEVKEETQLAAAIFDTLGTLGVTYIHDPANPNQIRVGETDFVDYIQYPRETLRRRSGDCNDVVALYSTLLEGVSISTRVLLVPGHTFMMFSTGVPADPDNYTMNNMYVIYGGTLWVPVETTVVGKPFAKAWELGSATYYKWKDKGLEILDVHQAWSNFKPATLPEDASWKVTGKARGEVEKAFPGDAMSIVKISSQTKTRRYLQAIQKDPSNMDAHLQVGIILAKVGDRTEAMKYFQKVLENNPKHAAALNNEGNLFMLDGQYQNAQKAYFDASKADPQDAEILVNLTKAYKAENNVGKAKGAFAQAQRLDPSLTDRYKALALELSGTLSPERRKASRSKQK
jgi:sugar lactone lactonase YvrE